MLCGLAWAVAMVLEIRLFAKKSPFSGKTAISKFCGVVGVCVELYTKFQTRCEFCSISYGFVEYTHLWLYIDTSYHFFLSVNVSLRKAFQLIRNGFVATSESVFSWEFQSECGVQQWKEKKMIKHSGHSVKTSIFWFFIWFSAYFETSNSVRFGDEPT